jgi:predicted ribosomally synthesized peptide with nif11-like leader
MAKDLNAFLERTREDSAFAEAVKEAGDRIAKAEEISGEGELLVRAAKDLGYEFTLGDIERSIADEQEVDDTELERVAGGASESDLVSKIIKAIGLCKSSAYRCVIWSN